MTEIFPAIVYVLCFVTSAACAWMLGRSFLRNGARLLLWSAICFALLAANNLVLVLDLVILPGFDLRVPRLVLSLTAVISLLWGFIWEAHEE